MSQTKISKIFGIYENVQTGGEQWTGIETVVTDPYSEG